MARRRSRKQSSRRRLILFAVILVASGLFLSWRGLLTVVLKPIAVPLTQAGTWVSERLQWRFLASEITPGELEALRSERDAYAQEAAELEALRSENSLLRAELDFLTRTTHNVLPAEIFSKSVTNATSEFLIGVGDMDGIQEGMAVVTGDGVFLGKIDTVGQRSSTVLTLTDPRQSVAVSLLNESRTIGIANGTIGDLLAIEFVPVDELIGERDLVVTSGLEPLVPPGLFVGTVNAVAQELGSPFQEAIVEPIADVRRVTHVLVVIPQETFDS